MITHNSVGQSAARGGKKEAARAASTVPHHTAGGPPDGLPPMADWTIRLTGAPGTADRNFCRSDRNYGTAD